MIGIKFDPIRIVLHGLYMVLSSILYGLYYMVYIELLLEHLLGHNF